MSIVIIADGALCHRRGRELYCVILWSALPKVPCLKKKKNPSKIQIRALKDTYVEVLGSRIFYYCFILLGAGGSLTPI